MDNYKLLKMINGYHSKMVIKLSSDLNSLKFLLSLRNEAATKIQKWYKSHKAFLRPHINALVASLENIRSQASILIQKVFKGYQVRSSLKFLRNIPQKKLIRWVHEASSVSLAGTFTEPPWKLLVSLKRCKYLNEFISTALVDFKVPRGTYLVKFLVDGVWVCDGNLPVSQDISGNYNNVIVINDQKVGISRAMSVRSFQSAANELASHIKTQQMNSPIILVRSISGNLESPRGFGFLEEDKIKHPVKLIMAGHMIAKPFSKTSALKAAGSADSWLIDEDLQFFGVADGVSEWSTFGLDTSRFPNELMKNCLKVLNETDMNETEETDLLERVVLEASHRVNSYGSSTLLLAICRNSLLYTYCLGDSSFIVLRKRDETSLVTVYRSLEQQHSFNCPFQLSNLPKPHLFEELTAKGFGKLVSLLKTNSKAMNDSPFDAINEMIPMKIGDIIIAGSDGLFDNLYDQDIIKTAEAKLSIRDTRQFCETLAVTLTEKAVRKGWDHNYKSPFARNAAKAGKKCMGGKPDDTTVVVAIAT
jgi:protein phosphatase PTC7